MALARVLPAAHKDEAARRTLLALRELTPQDPEINVELARLEARTGNLESAIGYDQTALYGAWPAARGAAHRELRLELVEYLLSHPLAQRALSELSILSSNMPEDADTRNRLGILLLRAGDAGGALEQFRKVLGSRRAIAEALAGAGRKAV